NDRKVRAECSERLCRRQPNAIGGTCDQDLLVVHGTAIQGSGHARMICLIIFDCWRGNGINLSMLSRARHEHSPRPCAIKSLKKGTQEPECRTFRPTRKRAGRAHGCCRKSYVKHLRSTSLLAGSHRPCTAIRSG